MALRGIELNGWWAQATSAAPSNGRPLRVPGLSLWTCEAGKVQGLWKRYPSFVCLPH